MVYVIGSLGRGGAELQLLMLMRGLSETEFDPVLFVLEENGPLREEVVAAGIPIIGGRYDSRAPRLLKIVQLLRAFVRLFGLLRSSSAQVVHGFLPLANFFAAVTGRLAGTRLIVTSRRALNTHQVRVPGWRYADRLSSQLSDIVTANAIAVRDDTLRREGGDPEKFRVIYNGLLAERFAAAAIRRDLHRRSLGMDKGETVLIVVANLIPYKGHADIVDALSLLPPRYRLRLLMVGEDRGIGDALRQRAREKHVDSIVEWLGPRNDIPELLAAADLYVSASHEEGFSNSLLEALASGKAIVATRVGGNPEMLRGGELGILVEPRNPAGLAAGIEALLRDTALRDRLGALAAADAARRYAPERMIDQYMSLYRAQGAHDTAEVRS